MILSIEKLDKRLINSSVLEYRKELLKKKNMLIIKRIVDIVFSLLGILMTMPIAIIISIFIKIDSKGPILYKQERITRNLEKFRIYKFRTMYINSDSNNQLITTKNDSRVTKIGKILRKLKIDELPQLVNVLFGDMTFVGTRPEVEKYVNEYSDEMLATLLLPAGITSFASVMFRNENDMLNFENLDKSYLNDILPIKMKFNLEYLRKISIFTDTVILFRTVINVLFRRWNYGKNSLYSNGI